MSKLLVLTLIVALVAVPILSAREPNARRGLKKALVLALTIEVLYLAAVRFVLPHLG